MDEPQLQNPVPADVAVLGNGETGADVLMELKKARVFILGMDGYLGWSLYCHLRDKVEAVAGMDNYSRRRWVSSIGSESLFPLPPNFASEARPILQQHLVYSPNNVEQFIAEFRPTTIIHFAEQPSAPYSMKNREYAAMTQHNNVIGTMNLLWMLRGNPKIHLIKLGTMGEYGDWIYSHDVEIPESNRIDVRYQGESISIPTPRWAGSFYHWSKVFDSFNLEFACRLWGLRATDLNQGVVYGTRIKGMEDHELTRFDYDSYFGTVVNRFIVQAIAGVPLTVYGKGGQTRGFLNINDTMNAVTLALQNPPNAHECCVVNQLTEVFSVADIAQMVQEETGCEIATIENPRAEAEEHLYTPKFRQLKNWGMEKPHKMRSMLPEMLADVEKYKDRIRKDVIQPETRWKGVYIEG